MKRKPSPLLSRQWRSESTRAAQTDPPPDPSASATGVPPPAKGLSFFVSPDILRCGTGKTITATATATGPDASKADVTVNYPGGSETKKGSVTVVYAVQDNNCGTVLLFSGSGNSKSLEEMVPVIKIKTETEAKHPANRQQKTIGVSEWVGITVTPNLHECTWNLTGSGTLLESGFTAEFLAGDREASPAIDATIKSTKAETIVAKAITCGFNFSVIEPTGVAMENLGNKPEMHIRGIPSAGFCARVFIVPNTVCFKNIQVFEGVAYYAGEGYWSPYSGERHPLGPIEDVFEGTDEHPSVMGKGDTVWKGGQSS